MDRTAYFFKLVYTNKGKVKGRIGDDDGRGRADELSIYVGLNIF